MPKLTLARALQNRKVIGGTLQTLSNRIKGCAVSDPEDAIDFEPAECLDQFEKEQFNLRELKIKAVTASVGTLVKIPEDAPVPEAGEDIPVYQAVLIRDDLRSRKALLEQLIGIPVNAMRWSRSSDAEEKIVRTRNFDFQKFVADIEFFQDMIMQIDSLIQYTDNTKDIG